MKNTVQIPLLAAAFACILAVSCDTPTSEGGGGNGGGGGEQDVVLSTAKFYAYDYREPYGTNNIKNYYTLTAEKKAVGQRCEVWVEQGAGISSGDAKAIAAEYDNNIYGIMQGALGYDTKVTMNGKTMSLFDAAD